MTSVEFPVGEDGNGQAVLRTAQGVDLDLRAVFTLPRKVVGGPTATEKLVLLAPSGSHMCSDGPTVRDPGIDNLKRSVNGQNTKENRENREEGAARLL
ncbi:hypothetical protein [Streptomyces viridosporus]|uniref:hypothetical protein n=1 Tax=Streptomyces viridosporus TaxID=67581 RepID=UPI00117F2861|nr:hypothetical protein [Streptomyces viridosporus]